MSAVLANVGWEPSVAGVADADSARWTPGESKSLSSHPATPLTRDERLRLFGHLSHEEKKRLRVLVDRARREREGLIVSPHQKITRTRCIATNDYGTRCRNYARSGDDHCTIHLRRMVA